MINGVTVLNSYNKTVIGIVYYIVAIIITMLIIFVWWKLYNVLDSTLVWIILILLSLLFISLICTFVGIGNSVMKTKYYEVIVDDSVNFNEFHDKYEIYEQNGKIFTISKKEN